jgi:ribosomal-protein-alanine N-acetyltransferase
MYPGKRDSLREESPDVHETPHLKTERLDLEPVTAEHADEAWQQLNDERMWAYFPQLRPASLDALRALYGKWQRGSPDEAEVWFNWLCRDRTSAKLVGGAQATYLPNEDASFVAYGIYPRFQRKGYAREAVRAVIAYQREAYGVRRILAEMHVRNAPSYRLVESLGFVRTQTRVDEAEYLYELTFPV